MTDAEAYEMIGFGHSLGDRLDGFYHFKDKLLHFSSDVEAHTWYNSVFRDSPFRTIQQRRQDIASKIQDIVDWSLTQEGMAHYKLICHNTL